MKERIKVKYWGLIVCSFLLTLTGCSQKKVEVYERPTQNVDAETISNDMEDETSSSPEIVNQEVKDSEETGDSPYEYTTSGGMISDDMYTNITADIGCLLEEGWRFLSKEEISELYSLTSEFGDEENRLDNASAGIYEIVAESTEHWGNLNVIINYKGGYVINEEDIAEQTMEPLVQSMKDMGYDDIEAEIITVPFIEGEHYAIKISAIISDIPYYYCGVIYESMRYLVNVNVASYEEDITGDVLDMFDTPINVIAKKGDRILGSRPKSETEQKQGSEQGYTTYKIDALSATVSLPNQYYVYSLDNPYTEEMCVSQGVTLEQMEEYLRVTVNDMTIFPSDEQIASSSFQMNVKVKDDTDYGLDNFKDLDDEAFQTYASFFVQSFGASEYSVLETEQVKYIVFDYNLTEHQKRYATIIQGKMVYFFGYESGKENMTDEHCQVLEEFAASLQLEY